MNVTPGRIVLYKLTSYDAVYIEEQRASRAKAQGLPSARSFGNEARDGDEYPAMVVRVFTADAIGTANLQVLLDGIDTYWATSRYNVDCDYVRTQQERGVFEAGKGCWRWPDRQTADQKAAAEVNVLIGGTLDGEAIEQAITSASHGRSL